MPKDDLDRLALDNQQLSEAIAALKSENEILVSVNAELQKKVEELSSTHPTSIGEAAEKAESEKKPVLPTETFEVEGKKYQFVSAVFMFNKERVTANAALSDSAILAELVKRKSGVIKEA